MAWRIPPLTRPSSSTSRWLVAGAHLGKHMQRLVQPRPRPRSAPAFAAAGAAPPRDSTRLLLPVSDQEEIGKQSVGLAFVLLLERAVVPSGELQGVDDVELRERS